MRPLSFLILPIVFALLVASSEVLEAQEKTADWSGQRVILKRPGIRIGYTDDSGKQTYIAELTSLSYAVLNETGGFLKVNHRGQTGWFSKEDALLPDAAIVYFSERAKINGAKDSYSYAYLGWAHKEKRQNDLALNAYGEALKREARAEWYNNRGLIHLDMKSPEKALADFSEAIKKNPAFVTALENRAGVLTQQKKLDEATADWSEVIKLDPKNATALARRARIHMTKNKLDAALADLNKSLEITPAEVTVLLNRGNVYGDLHQYDKAIADLDEVIKLEKTQPEHYIARAHLHTEAKTPAKAIDDLNEALKLLPQHQEARVARGWNLYLLGKYVEANKDYDAAIKQNANDPVAYNCQAWLWATCPDAKFRQGAKALEYSKKAIELSLSKEPGYLDTQAAAHAELGNFEEAARVQERAIAAFGPNDAELLAEARGRLDLYKKKQAYRSQFKGN